MVASEVRALAQRTTGAAREIRGLIEDSRKRVEDGAKRATEARERVDESMASVNRMTTMLDAIRLATQEQLLGTSQITQTLSHMDGITQQNAAMVEELAAASSALNEQVDTVHKSIRVFRLFPGDKTLAEDDAVALRKALKQEDPLKSEEVDFDKVIAAHQRWRVTLRNAVHKDKKLDADTLRRDDCCALGKWVYGPGGQRWGQLPVFKELVGHHKTFHAEAGKVADAINQGQPQRAEQMMNGGTPFIEAGHHVTQCIRMPARDHGRRRQHTPNRPCKPSPGPRRGQADRQACGTRPGTVRRFKPNRATCPTTQPHCHACRLGWQR